MQKAILYGTGGSGKRLLHELAQTYDIVGFTDSDERIASRNPDRTLI